MQLDTLCSLHDNKIRPTFYRTIWGCLWHVQIFQQEVNNHHVILPFCLLALGKPDAVWQTCQTILKSLSSEGDHIRLLSLRVVSKIKNNKMFKSLRKILSLNSSSTFCNPKIFEITYIKSCKCDGTKKSGQRWLGALVSKSNIENIKCAMGGEFIFISTEI